MIRHVTFSIPGAALQRQIFTDGRKADLKRANTFASPSPCQCYSSPIAHRRRFQVAVLKDTTAIWMLLQERSNCPNRVGIRRFAVSTSTMQAATCPNRIRFRAWLCRLPRPPRRVTGIKSTRFLMPTPFSSSAGAEESSDVGTSGQRRSDFGQQGGCHFPIGTVSPGWCRAVVQQPPGSSRD